MIIKSMFIMVLISFVALYSCTKNQIEFEDYLFGEWQMLDDPSKGKQICLNVGGNAQFINLQSEDMGIENKGILPAKGHWILSPNGKILRFEFVMHGVTYDHSGRLVRKKNSFELWFSVGDPDDFIWKRFRLKKTNRKGVSY